MSAGNTLPHNQPGQRSLRLVAPAPPAAPPVMAPPAETPNPAPAAKAVPSPTLRRLQRDLEAARAEAHSLHELLEQLPAILERKFELRLGALLAEQRQLQLDNAVLHHHLLALHSGGVIRTAEPAVLPPSSAANQLQAVGTQENLPGQSPPMEQPITQGLGLRRALRHLHL